MSNGVKLRGFIASLLETMSLTSQHKADIATMSSNDYEPDDLELAMIDVQIMVAENDIGGLLKLMRKLPSYSPPSNDLADYLSLPHSKELSSTKIGSGILADKAYRISNIYKIIDKNHKLVMFSPNVAQQALIEAQAEHCRVIILKSRQRGLTTFALLDALDTCLSEPNKIRGLQAADLKSANAIMTKAVLAYRELPNSIKPTIVYSNNTELSFSNGSKLLIATSFRGSTLSGLHVSELGRISLVAEKAAELRSGTFSALPANKDTQVILESTSEGGGSNMFATMYEDAKTNYRKGNYRSYLPLFIGWIGIVKSGVLTPNTADPDCWLEPHDETGVPKELNSYLLSVQKELNYTFSEGQIEWCVATYIELGSDLVELKREFPCTEADCWASGSDGLILQDAYVRLATTDTNLTHNPKYPLYAAADLGTSDTFVVLLFQYYDRKIYIVDELHGTGQPLSYYINYVMENKVDRLFLPHDAKNRELTTAKKRTTAIRAMGFKDFVVMKRSQNLWDSIRRTRTMMPLIVFGDVPETISAVKSYRKKWSTLLGAYEDVPLHNDASNYADALRYCVDGCLDYIL